MKMHHLMRQRIFLWRFTALLALLAFGVWLISQQRNMFLGILALALAFAVRFK
jgi:hypothetical protein